jgi:hypothetical protein
MRVLALDPATITGVADGIAGGTPVLSTVHLRKSPDDDFDDLMDRAARWMLERLASDPPRVLVLETPVPPLASRNFDSTKVAMGLDGLWTGIARSRGVYVRHARVQEWRAGVLGNGRMKGPVAKARMVEMCKRLKWPAIDHNAAEAAGVWLFACQEIRARRMLGGLAA